MSDALGPDIPASSRRWRWILGGVAAACACIITAGGAYTGNSYVPGIAGSFGFDFAKRDAVFRRPITHVQPGSPAERAGVKVGDAIILDHEADWIRTPAVTDWISATIFPAVARRAGTSGSIPTNRLTSTNIRCAPPWVPGWALPTAGSLGSSQC